MPPLLWHLLVRGVLATPPVHFLDDRLTPKPLGCRWLLLRLFSPLWLFPVLALAGAALFGVGVGVAVPLALTVWLPLLRGPSKPFAQVRLVPLLPVLLVLVLFLLLPPLSRWLKGLKQVPVDRVTCRWCSVPLLVLLVQDLPWPLRLWLLLGVARPVHGVNTAFLAGLLTGSRPLSALHYRHFLLRQAA